MGHVHPDLVGAARLQAQAQQRVALLGGQNLPVGNSGLAVLPATAADFAAGLQGDGGFHRAVAGKLPLADGVVRLFHLGGGHGGPVLAHQEDAAGVLIQAVQGAECRGLAGPLVVEGHPVEKAVPIVARRGVHRHGGRLVHGQVVLVLVEDGEGPLHRLVGLRLLRQRKAQPVPGAEQVHTAAGLAVFHQAPRQVFLLDKRPGGQPQVLPGKVLDRAAVPRRRDGVGEGAAHFSRVARERASSFRKAVSPGKSSKACSAWAVNCSTRRWASSTPKRDT